MGQDFGRPHRRLRSIRLLLHRQIDGQSIVDHLLQIGPNVLYEMAGVASASPVPISTRSCFGVLQQIAQSLVTSSTAPAPEQPAVGCHIPGNSWLIILQEFSGKLPDVFLESSFFAFLRLNVVEHSGHHRKIFTT